MIVCKKKVQGRFMRYTVPFRSMATEHLQVSNVVKVCEYVHKVLVHVSWENKIDGKNLPDRRVRSLKKASWIGIPVYPTRVRGKRSNRVR